MQAFLSLYLVLLAFFIVLASVSQQDTGRVVKAIASVRATFPSDLPLGSASGQGTSLFVEVERGLPDRVGRLVEADLPLTAPSKDAATGQVATEVKADVFFEGAGLTRPGEGLLRRIASFLAAPPDGARLVVTALVPDGDSQSADRAARIARTLIEDGAPADTITIGTDRTAGGSVRFFFAVRSAEAAS